MRDIKSVFRTFIQTLEKFGTQHFQLQLRALLMFAVLFFVYDHMIFQLNLVFAIATPLSTPLAEESQSVRAYFLRALAHRCGVIQLECGCTKWVPTNYQWSYNLFEWPYRVLNPTSGGLTLLIIRMGPLCKIPVNFGKVG